MRGPKPCSLRHSASRLYSHCWTCCSGRPVSADKMVTSDGCMFLFRRKWQSSVDSWSADSFSEASVDSTCDVLAHVDISTKKKLKRIGQISEEVQRRCAAEDVTNTGNVLPSAGPFNNNIHFKMNNSHNDEKLQLYVETMKGTSHRQRASQSAP